MRKITDFIVKHRNIIIILFIILSIISIFISKKVKINYDMTEYMPQDSETRLGLDIMNKEFEEDNTSVLNIMFKNLTDDEKVEIQKKLSDIPGVSSIEYEKDSEEYNKDENTLYILNVDEAEDSKTAKNIYEYVNENFKDYEFYTSGTIADRNMEILPTWIIALAVLICTIILIIMCESYIEPFLFLICIGIAVLLNSGTNIILGTVSNITSSIAAILQLALSMDYSIMLINRYKQEKEKNNNKVEAMKEALYKSFSSILSSSVTTVVGLLALIFMSFTIGRDLGIVLAKGVLLSLLVIFTCLPSLILMFDKLITKTKKKAPKITLDWLGKFIYKFRKVGFILLIVLFVGSYILKGNLGILYTASEQDKIAEVFPENNQMAIIYKSEDEEKIEKYLNELENNEKVDDVLAYGNTIGEKLKYNEFNNKLQDLEVDTQIEDYLLKILYYKYYNEDTENRMTFNEFVYFTKNNVLNNKDFSSKIDENTKNDIDKLEKFASTEEINKKRTYDEVANILEIDENDCYNLFVYYYSDKTNITLTVDDFINFIKKDVLTNSNYSGSIPEEAKNNIEIVSQFTNKNTINKSLTSKEMANLFGIDESQVKELYLYYYSIYGTNTKISLNEFANFIIIDVLTNPDFNNMIDNNTVENIKLLQTMSNTTIINKEMNIDELSYILGLDKNTINQVLLLINSTQDTGTKLSIKEFINYIIYLEENTEYLKGMNLNQIIYLKDFANNTNNINNVKMNKEQLSQVFNNVNKELVDIVYIKANLKDDYTMTTQEFINFVIDNFSNDINKEELNNLKVLKIVIEDSLNTKDYTATQMSEIFGINKSDLYKIYALFNYTNGNNTTQTISPYRLVKFIIDNIDIENIASNITQENLSKLKLAYNIMNSSNNKVTYTYTEISKLLGIDEDLTKKVYALYSSNKEELKLTPITFTNFILQHKDDSVLKNSLNNSTLNNLTLIQEIMNATLNGKQYSATQMSGLLNMNNEDIKLLYSLYSAKYLNPNMQSSLKEFVEFILNNVITNEKYSSKFDTNSITKLNTINGIMNAVINKTEYSAEEIFAILSILTDSIDQNTIDILYIYYGSENYYNEEWKMTIEQLIDYVSNNILEDSRFDDFIDEETRSKITDAYQTIQDSKQMLVGNEYSRIILNTKFNLEGEETFNFLKKIYEDLDGTELYIIGDSPMAYEMSKTFESEFNKISIITMIAIFIVVAFTFKSIGIPSALVLLIQCAVYLTMGILGLLGGEIYFIALLIVQSILMGATIDYAILYTSYYKESRVNMDVKESVINSYNKSIHTILTSSSILILATFIVGKYASAIVSKICITLSQGVLCSTILILLILPPVLATLDKLIVKKAMRKGENK